MAMLSVGHGRAAVSVYRGRQYCVGFADVRVDSQQVAFVPLDGAPYTMSRETLNGLLQTEDFYMWPNSNVTCSLYSGMVDPADSTNLVTSFSDNQFMDVKAAVIDATTGKMLSLLGDYRIVEGQDFSPAVTDHQFSIPGPGSRKVRIALALSDNVQPAYVINELFTNGSTVGITKSTAHDVLVSGDVTARSYTLYQNHPNPFNPSTEIHYDLPQDHFVSLKVYDLFARELATLVHKNESAGHKVVKFDANSLSSGVYFYRLKAGNFVGVKKMLLIR